jgi:hypothetical protein
MHVTLCRPISCASSWTNSPPRKKNCPKAWQGSFSGKEKQPTIVLEAISDHLMWFWHASYGYAGTLNDLNVLNLSPFLDALRSGKFAEIEKLVVPYEIGLEEFKWLYILVHGIYPKYHRFVKGMKEPITRKERTMTSWQEGARKDIKKAFEVLQSKFQWIARPINLHNLNNLSGRVASCLILHNMTVSDRVMDSDVNTRYNPANSLEEDFEVTVAQDEQAIALQDNIPQELFKLTNNQNTKENVTSGYCPRYRYTLIATLTLANL